MKTVIMLSICDLFIYQPHPLAVYLGAQKSTVNKEIIMMLSASYCNLQIEYKIILVSWILCGFGFHALGKEILRKKSR
jgi:hypothetical protein